MDSFYIFYTKDNGRLSVVGRDLVEKADYKNAVIHYESLIQHFGSLSSLGMGDAIAYLHSKFATGQAHDGTLDFPKPITRNELTYVYEYELFQERLIKDSIPGRKFLSVPLRVSKAILASKIAADNGCTTAIETGTFLGRSTYLFSGVFDEVHTIEADTLLYESSTHWLTRLRSNIITHSGNSVEKLSSILSNKNSKSLIVLDAHWSGGITSGKYGICPLIEELSLIFSQPNDDVIVVDDIRDLDGPKYPTFRQILDCVPFGKKITIEHDTMFIIG